MKKVLLKVQGINVISDYMVKEFEMAEVDLSNYEKIIYINTEKEFDRILKRLPNFLKTKIYKRRKSTKDKYNRNEVTTKLEWVDYAVDIWAFFADADIYNTVTRKVRKAAAREQDNGYTVDLFSHSLGTLISLHSGAVINNFFCVASPLGINNFILRKLIEYHFINARRKMTSKNTILVWGTADNVSKNTNRSVKQVLRKYTDELHKFKLDVGHKLLHIFEELKTTNQFNTFIDFFTL